MAKPATIKQKVTKANTNVHEELFNAIANNNPKFSEQGGKETEAAYYLRMLEGIGDLSEEEWTSLSNAAQAWYSRGVGAANEDQPIPACPGFVSKTVVKARGPGRPAKAADPEPEEVEEEVAVEEEPVEEEGEIEEEAPPAKKANVATKKPAPKIPVAPAKKLGRPAKAAEPEPEEVEEEPVEEEVEIDEEPAPKKVAAKKAAAPAPAKKEAFGGKRAPAFEKKDPAKSVAFQIRKYLVKNIDYTTDQIRKALEKKGFEDVKSSTINTLRNDVRSTITAAKEVGVWGAE